MNVGKKRPIDGTPREMPQFKLANAHDLGSFAVVRICRKSTLDFCVL